MNPSGHARIGRGCTLVHPRWISLGDPRWGCINDGRGCPARSRQRREASASITFGGQRRLFRASSTLCLCLYGSIQSAEMSAASTKGRSSKGTRASVEVARPFVFPVENLKLSTAWQVGPVRLDPPGDLLRMLKRSPARRSRLPGRRWLVDHTIAEAERIKTSATVTVLSDEQEEAANAAIQVMRLLRLFQRGRYPMIELLGQTFGLPGELYEVYRTAVVMGRSPSVHRRRLGNLGEWEFTTEDRDAFHVDPRFQYLLGAITTTPDQRGEAQQRGLLSLELIDVAWISPDPRIQTLNLAIAMEVLLSAHDTLGIARRAAYLTYPATCGRGGTPACRYLYPFKGRAQITAFIKSSRAKGSHSLCSAFLDISETLFGVRNMVVHEGLMPPPGARETVRYWDVERVYLAAVEWFAAHPTAALSDLDSEINLTLIPKSSGEGSD